MMTGGAAKSAATVKALQKNLGTKIMVLPEPQIMGALGEPFWRKKELTVGHVSEGYLAVCKLAGKIFFHLFGLQNQPGFLQPLSYGNA